jgi:hypothetical protein
MRYFHSKLIVSNVPLFIVHDHKKHFVACFFITYGNVYVFEFSREFDSAATEAPSNRENNFVRKPDPNLLLVVC